jgi:signal transduction histidine kinase/CheY-like chemotaxis protein
MREQSLWMRAAHRFIPERMRGDIALYRQARTAVGVSFAIAPFGLVFGLVHWFTLPPQIAGIVGPTILSVGAAGLAGPLLVRVMGPKALHLVLGYCFAALTVLAFCLGGPQSAEIYWLLAIPFPAILVFGGRGAWWLGAALVTAAGFYAFHLAGFQFPNYLSVQLTEEKWVASVCGATLFLTIQLWVYADFQARAYRVLQATHTELARAHADAEASNCAKSSFLANVSHKLRTPMTSVLGYTELLLRRSAGPGALPAETAGLLGTISRNGRHLLAVIDDILDISKLEAGTIEIQLARESLDDLLDDVVALMRARAESRGLELRLERFEPLPRAIETDPKRLRQILFNLLGNAIKFTPSGRVTLRVSCSEAGGEPLLRFEVEDTGIGMSPAELGHVFTPFAQADASITRLYGGTGLGLSICKRFAELLGGRISVASEAGRGSCFRVELPLCAARDRASAPTESLDDARAVPACAACPVTLRAHIALGDAHADNRALLREVLNAAGAQVDAFEDASTALERARQAELFGTPYDAVVADIAALADNATLRELRRRVRATPVIAISADAFELDRERCLAAGFDDYVTKPVDVAALCDAIANHSVQAGACPARAASKRALPAARLAPGAPAAVDGSRWLERCLFPAPLETHQSGFGSTHAVLALCYAAIAALSYLSGGVLTPAGYWLYLLPISAMSLRGPCSAFSWAGLCALQFSAFFLLARHGYAFPVGLTGETRLVVSLASFAVLAPITVAFAYGFERRRERTIVELARANSELASARDAAERASRTKTQFLANISHELRTPMTAILGFTELIAESGAESLRDPDALRALAAIQRNGSQLLQTIDDLLDLSKLEAGRLRIEHIPFAPASVAAEAVDLMRARAQAAGLPLALHFETALPARCQGDPTRLRQILVHLIGNAIRFTKQGQLGVHVSLNCAGKHSQLAFEVRDSGSGLSQDQLELLFAPYPELASGEVDYVSGGLGLAISRRLTALMRGSLTAWSTPGQGSAVRLALATGPLDDTPLVWPSKAAPEGDAESVPAIPPGCRVLLAEDCADNRRLISLLLQNAGVESVAVENGREALECIARAELEGKPFDVILMDMHMPLLDGFEATRRLRTRAYAGPIVALTAYALSEAREACLAAGCDDFLTKPIERARLLATVARLSRDAKRVSAT